jgi:hypothetical protein
MLGTQVEFQKYFGNILKHCGAHRREAWGRKGLQDGEAVRWSWAALPVCAPSALSSLPLTGVSSGTVQSLVLPSVAGGRVGGVLGVGELGRGWWVATPAPTNCSFSVLGAGACGWSNCPTLARGCPDLHISLLPASQAYDSW